MRGDGAWATPPDTNTTYSIFNTTTDGLVPKTTTSNTTDFLRRDGTWATPPNTNTLNTAGSTDTASKIFLVGATSQAANPQTYSDNEVFATNGVLNAKTFTSTVVTGTAPLIVSSTTPVANLQAATATKLHNTRAITVGPTAKKLRWFCSNYLYVSRNWYQCSHYMSNFSSNGRQSQYLHWSSVCNEV